MIKKFILVVMVLALVIALGCTERVENSVEPNYEGRNSNGVVVINGGHLYSIYLGLSMFSEISSVPQMDTKIYFPEGYELDGSGLINLPVLYLLSPFRANADYYFGHGLVRIADEMIANGEIDPMFIVCIDGSHGYGATFYGNSWAGGRYTDLIGDKTGRAIDEECAIIDYISEIVWTDTSRAMRGISGFDLGGYGAMRVAIEYSENFGSVTAVSAPLDFDGASGNGGFIPLFQEIATKFDSYASFKDIAISYEDPLRTLMIGAACSFSPSRLDFADPWYNWPYPTALDTFIIDDSLTEFSLGGPGSDVSFHLPFDFNGNIPDTLIYLTYYDTTFDYDTTFRSDSVFSYYDSLIIDTNMIGFELVIDTTLVFTDTIFVSMQTVIDHINKTVDYIAETDDTVGYYDGIWGLWMDNNIGDLLSANPGALDNTAIQLYTVSDDYYGFGQQTRDFATAAGPIIGQDLTPINYEGTDNYEATVGHYVNEILPAILKFHSDQFRGGEVPIGK